MTLLVSSEYLSLTVPKSIQLVDISVLSPVKEPVWPGALPFGVLVQGDQDISKQTRRFLKAMQIPIHTTQPALAQQVIITILGDQVSRLAHEAAQERRASSAIRKDFMELQQGFAIAERFLYGAMMPEFTLAREWEMAGEYAQGPFEQPLPVGSAGLAAVDVWCKTKGDIVVRFCRPTGEDFCPAQSAKATQEGWCRVQLDAPLTGLSEDVVLRVSGETEFGLSHRSPLERFGAHPIALRLYKGIPGAEIPTIPADLNKPGIFPASHFPKPSIIGDGSVEVMGKRDALSLHPGPDGSLHAVFHGLAWNQAHYISVFVQNHGPEIVQLSLASTKGDPAFDPPQHLSPGVYMQCGVDLVDGQQDLHLKLFSQTPVAHVIIWGFEVRSV